MSVLHIQAFADTVCVLKFQDSCEPQAWRVLTSSQVTMNIPVLQTICHIKQQHGGSSFWTSHSPHTVAWHTPRCFDLWPSVTNWWTGMSARQLQTGRLYSKAFQLNLWWFSAFAMSETLAPDSTTQTWSEA